jgi:hypothetical protein
MRYVHFFLFVFFTLFNKFDFILLATGWAVLELNPGGGKILYIHPDRLCSHPASWKVGISSISLGYSNWDVVFTTHPHLVPRFKKE